MVDHWTQGINLKSMLQYLRPLHVLEVGALNGETTSKLIELMPEVGYQLTVISDDGHADSMHPHVTSIRWVSYDAFRELPDESIDFCIIDTDHNYWTLNEELYALHPKLRVGAHVVLHDVETFYYDTGVADGYGVSFPYPEDEIVRTGEQAGSLGTCLIDFLSRNKFAYRLVRWIPESNGVAVIRKNPAQFNIGIFRAVPGAGRRTKVAA